MFGYAIRSGPASHSNLPNWEVDPTRFSCEMSVAGFGICGPSEWPEPASTRRVDTGPFPKSLVQVIDNHRNATSKVVYRFLEFDGIGPKIATVASGSRLDFT